MKKRGHCVCGEKQGHWVLDLHQKRESIDRQMISADKLKPPPRRYVWRVSYCTSWTWGLAGATWHTTSIEGFLVTSYQVNFSSHCTCLRHVGVLFARPSIGWCACHKGRVTILSLLPGNFFNIISRNFVQILNYLEIPKTRSSILYLDFRDIDPLFNDLILKKNRINKKTHAHTPHPNTYTHIHNIKIKTTFLVKLTKWQRAKW